MTKQKQVSVQVNAKSNKASIIGTREIFKGKDIVNLREFAIDGDDMIATKNGFTIPADQFQSMFNSLRKFGRAAGLLPEKGEDPKEFEMKSLDDVVADDDEEEESEDTPKVKEKKAKRSKDSEEVKEVKSKIQRRLKKDEDDEEEKKPKRAKKEAASNDDDGFSMKDFIKAIKKADKHPKDLSYVADVMVMYKKNRKAIANAKISKHAINACEKAMANKKDESYAAKAVASLHKHLVENA